MSAGFTVGGCEPPPYKVKRRGVRRVGINWAAVAVFTGTLAAAFSLGFVAGRKTR